jgi:hypothetical protein
MNDFFEKEKSICMELTILNKKFMIFIINYIQYYLQSINKGGKKNKKTQELVTVEEIKKDKISKFDNDLLNKKEEFDNLMKTTVPILPNFSDKMDIPLEEPLNLLENMIQKRQLEEEKFNIILDTVETNKKWITPQTTTIKSKINYEKSASSDIKYIKIENEIIDSIEEDIYLLDAENINENQEKILNYPTKHISWNDNNEIINLSPHYPMHNPDVHLLDKNNIFSKIKKIELDIPSEIKFLKEEIKIIYNKMDEINNTMNNILVYIKLDKQKN